MQVQNSEINIVGFEIRETVPYCWTIMNWVHREMRFGCMVASISVCKWDGFMCLKPCEVHFMWLKWSVKRGAEDTTRRPNHNPLHFRHILLNVALKCVFKQQKYASNACSDAQQTWSSRCLIIKCGATYKSFDVGSDKPFPSCIELLTITLDNLVNTDFTFLVFKNVRK
jgi:hypothetical protein